MVSDPRAVNSLVAFRNSQGADARGTLLKLTRTTLIFEVYNPYSIVQLSEVLRDVQIRRGERIIYRGRAVVTSLVNTGLMLIVSATLTDTWSDLSGAANNAAVIRKEVQEFVEDWEESYRLRPGYQIIVARLRSFLTELNRWLEQLDVGGEEADQRVGYGLDPELFEDLTRPIFPRLYELFQQFEDEAGMVPDEEITNHKRFVQNDLHPLMLRSPFVHRSFYKPLGYAGDYEMVNMMLRDPREGPTVYAQIINTLYLHAGPPAAHRNRIELLLKRLRESAAVAAREGRELRVLNIGCGPAVEIQEFLKRDPLVDRCDFRLLDFNEETLEYAKQRINIVANEYSRKPRFEFVHESVHSLLKAAAKRTTDHSSEEFDLVYCAGLFDYLSDKVCSRLLRLFYQWTKPSGSVLATNVHPDNPNRFAMEHIMEWYLIYRNEQQMAELVPELPDKKIYADTTGVNVFLEFARPACKK